MKDFHLRRVFVSLALLFIVGSMYIQKNYHEVIPFSHVAFWHIFVAGILVGNIMTGLITYFRERSKE